MAWPLTLPLLRAIFAARSRYVPAGVEVVTISGGLSVRLYHPVETVGQRCPALLWIHGGGYVVGRAAQDDRQCQRYARKLGAVVASVDYRLAPEHSFPAPLEDCYAALMWLANLPTVDAQRIAIGGASAGGGLAAALAFLIRDRGQIQVAAQLLLYPMLDDRTSTRRSRDRRNGLRMWNHASNRWGWASYLGTADPQLAVPARQADLSGLPPAWIGVGTNDLFYREDLKYARRLTDAGVPCTLEVVAGAFHGFDVVAPNIRVSSNFFDSQRAMIEAAFTRLDGA